jgi:phage shock protein PspC (stress-responsive transcriptional regulator)
MNTETFTDSRTDTETDTDTDTRTDPQAGTTDTATTDTRQLRRPIHNRMLTGVAAGIADYLGVDANLVRIGFAVLTVMGGVGVPLYIAGLLLIPEEGSDQSLASSLSSPSSPDRPTEMSSTQTKNFFGPLLNGTYGDQNVRVSDAERQAIADRLAVHYGDGRLDHAEFDERIGRAMSAKTRGDLRGILDDLPEPGPAGAPGTMASRPVSGSVARRHRHPVLLVAFLVFVALVVAHAVFWLAIPALFLGLVFVAVLAVARAIGRPRAR